MMTKDPRDHMEKRRILLSSLLLVGLLLVSGCASPFVMRANARLKELDTILATVPEYPKSDLIERRDHIGRSRESRCATVSIMQLFGTNEATLPEVVEWYVANLDPGQWQVEHQGTGGVSAVLMKNKQVSLEISDNYRWVPVWHDAVQQGHEAFKTLIFISISSFVYPGVTLTDCL